MAVFYTKNFGDKVINSRDHQRFSGVNDENGTSHTIQIAGGNAKGVADREEMFGVLRENSMAQWSCVALTPRLRFTNARMAPIAVRIQERTLT